MPLQMDSTVLYAEGRDGGTVHQGRPGRPARPYNTYLNKGLTPTPICFPSRGRPAGHPRPARRHLAVLRGGPVQDGTEAFADTFAQQQANEALAQQRGLG